MQRSGHFMFILALINQEPGFSNNLALSYTFSYGFPTTYQNLEKTYDQFQEYSWTDRRTDVHTLFYRTLLANARGLKRAIV